MSRRVFNGSPCLKYPVSQACTQNQFESAVYKFWCDKFKETPRYHRKQWEFCYILQALATNGKLAPGMRGVGYGVGQEPLTATFASYGCEVLATDLSTEDAHSKGWIETQQHISNKQALNDRLICPPELFEENVSFEFADMNNIPERYTGFDFTWSACCLEHLGSIEKGLCFIEKSVDTLAPGGVAVHTTELNCTSDVETIDNEGTVLFRKSDILDLMRRLAWNGHEVEVNFNTGDAPLDQHIDVPPYSSDKHLKLMIGRFSSTSYGIIVKKSRS